MSHADGTENSMDALVEWIRSVTDAAPDDDAVVLERRSAGASRAGYAVDVRRRDGTTQALWLRLDTGHGPQSQTMYTVHREATVYAALRSTAVRVPSVVAVHPTVQAFLSERLDGRNWFSEITSPDTQTAVARAYVQQLAALHSIDPRTLALDALGEPASIQQHVREELDAWELQHRAHEEPEPLLVLAFSWLRRNLPPDDGWPVVLVHGDAGPGNFLYDGDDVVAVMDWEMAHLGDLHDDLGWLYVRDTQERFTDLPARLQDYAAALGRPIDLARLRYFRVLAQLRCAIGTRNGLLARDSQGEIANHLIYSTLHHRLLVEALADAMEVALPDAAPPLPSATSTETWMYEVALDDLRAVVLPAIQRGGSPEASTAFASRRAKGLARLLKYLRDVDRFGPAARRADLAELHELLDAAADDDASDDIDAVVRGRAALCAAIGAGTVADVAALQWCAAASARATAIARDAMGALADRHYAPLP
jgi:aminoglycoside phosphotransferase (APT) family kinase protein